MWKNIWKSTVLPPNKITANIYVLKCLKKDILHGWEKKERKIKEKKLSESIIKIPSEKWFDFFYVWAFG